MEAKYLVKLKVYLALTVASTIALLGATALTGHFDEKLLETAVERVSEHFVYETIFLIGLVLIGACAGFILQAIGRRNGTGAAVVPGEVSFLQEWIGEMPRAAYLLGAVMSSVFYVLALKQGFGAGNWIDAIKAVAVGFYLTFVFGAWGHLLDLIIDTPFSRIWRSLVLLTAVTALSLAAPPVSFLPAVVLFGALWNRLGLNKPS